jgi:hypothetical protein
MVAGCAIVAFALLGCAGRGEDNSACGWLFAPPSFVDAGSSTCTFEPAGQVCNPATGRCESVCQPSEFILTCRNTIISRISIAERAFEDPAQRDPASSSGPSDACSLVQEPAEGSRWQTVYCCPCERRL